MMLREETLRGALAHMAGDAGTTREARAARAAAFIRESGAFRWVGLYDVDHGARQVRVLAWDGPGAPASPEFAIDRGITARAIATGVTVNAGNVLDRPDYLTTFDSTRSELIVPVVDASGAVVGTLDIESERVDAFPPLVQDALEQCALALRALWHAEDARPLGPIVDDAPARRPGPVELRGRYARLEPLDAERHGPALFEATHGSRRDRVWTYLRDGPFDDPQAFVNALRQKAAAPDYVYLAIVDGQRRARGHAAYMRIEPSHRVIEVGDVLFTPELQGTTAATEAMYLMARHAFEELGYRRYEWKCHAMNTPSRSAALRLGFRFEGVFRQHLIIKGRNRDTAWYSMLDSEWPSCKAAFEAWLDPSNFDATGRQLRSLADLRSRTSTVRRAGL